MPVPRSLDGFDVTAAIERMLDQPMLWWQAVGLFVEHFADGESGWQESIGDDAWEQKKVHALRGAAANVGAMALAEVAADLEDLLLACREGKVKSVPNIVRQRLRDSFRQTWRAAAGAWKPGPPGSGERG